MCRIVLVVISFLAAVQGYQHDGSQLRATNTRKLQPPFPNGPCGGHVETVDARHLYNNLLSNTVLLPPRPIQIWIPPTTTNTKSGKRCSVLYCHDGQNAMDDNNSWTGSSWRLMGSLTRLHNHGLISEMPMVVLIPSATDDLVPGIRRRHLEYGHVGQVFADAHVDFIANTLKPFVDTNFGVYTSPQHTFAMGTSLGGQASLHLLLRYGHLFGGAACLSPAFQPPTIIAALRDVEGLKDKKIYMDIGGDVGDIKVPFFHVEDHLTSQHWWNPGYFFLDTQLQPTVDAMSMALGLSGIHHVYNKIPGARHNERAWAQRIHLPLLHLFGNNS